MLARELAQARDDIDTALRRYQAVRLPRTSRIQLAARSQERFAHQAARNAPVNSDWLYEYDATKAVAC